MWARSSLALLALAGLGAILAAGGKAAVTPVKVAPASYFDRRCSRCHGRVDSPANTAFEKPIPIAKLRQTVADMAAGPGGEPLTGPNLDALVALHQAMSAREPFLVWTGVTAEGVSGEMAPGTKLKAEAGGKPLKVAVTGSTWSIKLPAKIRAAAVTLKGTREGRSVVLKLSERAWR